MKIIATVANPSGGYPPIQEGPFDAAPTETAEWPETLETETFYQYNGFVTLTVEDGQVKDYKPNTEAWEAWKTSLPKPGPEPAEITMEDVAQVMVDHEVRLAILELTGGETV